MASQMKWKQENSFLSEMDTRLPGPFKDEIDTRYAGKMDLWTIQDFNTEASKWIRYFKISKMNR
uniref:Uncharacterized protein n=1 Tax=Rhizophagus irregularis (strain DAOM 181602 / DAOM 197198 / MUCL 43194) TaxID=747089 RepID=U9TF71_RHIID